MDIATRFQTRARTGPYLDQEPTLPNIASMDTSGSSGESDNNFVRRKFQRTTSGTLANLSYDANANTNGTSNADRSVFRKPSIPASASRPAATTNTLERLPSLTNQQYKRRSTLQRENQRIPSGPREFPSPSRQRQASTTSNAPSISDSTNAASRSYLPQSRPSQSGDELFYDAAPTNINFSNPLALAANSANTTPGTEVVPGFLPDVNFDDFQTSIGRGGEEKDYSGVGKTNYSSIYDSNGFGDGRTYLRDEKYTMPRPNGYTARSSGSIPQQQQQQHHEEPRRTPSLRQRLAANDRQRSAAMPLTHGKDTTALASRDDSLRARRQSSISTTNTAVSAPTYQPLPQPSAAAKQPRKSIGPSMITSLMKGGSAQDRQASESGLKPAIARNSSLSKGSRRTTIQPTAALAGAELPRVSTLTATTQSRQNKVKSLSAAPKEANDVTSTPTSTTATKTAAKNVRNERAHTPSSSGNRRQSLASGRASGLGARTISPTDARRLKRMSTVNPPPMPTMSNLTKGAQPPPTPQEEMPAPTFQSNARPSELPRLTQPSPSMIPRKSSNATLNSTRASSPEGRYGQGGVSLSSKSSYSSLNSMSMNASSSRLPTPKPRNGSTQSGSAMGQYSDAQDRFTGASGGGDEMVPPVPAIPKAYESPKDLESNPPFFSTLFKSSVSTFASASDTNHASTVPTPWTSTTPRSSLEGPAETPKKRSGDHKRTSTLTNGMSAVPPPSAPPKFTAPSLPDPNGRKNANLQPLRLPPLNLMPINTRGAQNASFRTSDPRPSQEVDNRDDDLGTVQTPEPKRMATKTPSTPMTASKATFFSRRQDEADKALRSSSSHYALRDVMGMETSQTSNFWDESDVENAGVPIPQFGGANGKARNAITPFSSGSLPKGSGEYTRIRLGEEEFVDAPQTQSGGKPQGPRVRMQRGATVTSFKGSLGGESAMSIGLDSPAASVEQGFEKAEKAESGKKEKEKSGEKEQSIRRKLSLGWRRSSSKAATHADHKSSPSQQDVHASEREKERKRQMAANDMPPPKLPASSSSTAMWAGEIPSLPTSARGSLESFAKRKSLVPNSVSTTSLVSVTNTSTDAETASISGSGKGVKTRSQHTEQPTPVTSSTMANKRTSSWGNLSAALRLNNSKANNATAAAATPSPRHRTSTSAATTLSALTKDKDDTIADDEMARLSRKRKDVDTAARESEDLRKRAQARSPVTAESVLHDGGLRDGEVLNVYERGEVVDFEERGVYFTGTKSCRKIIGSLEPGATTSVATTMTTGASADPNKNGVTASSTSTNFGYDDERGDYNVVLGDHLMYRYEVVDVLGKGSFGQVVRCVDHKDGGVVAVKIIRNKKRFHQQALVEVGILGKLGEWDPDGAHATLSITSSFYFRSHLCIVTPCLSINLYELIRAHNFVGFSLPLIRRFARQLLACLTLLQTKKIIHCDLKPENILLCEARKADVRVIDFGSSCREEEKVYTYIQSRFYRSPEVILGSSYGLGIDMWSLGCILAELWTGYPIFPGENEQEQLACIMEIFGPPDRHLVERCTRKKLFFDSVGKPRVTVSSKGRRRRPSTKTLQQALKTEDEAFVDFITRCLRWDPERRLKPNEAISHPFITNSPLTQRAGVPEEARRAARIRSQAAVPAGGQGAASPVKRNATNPGNAFAQQQAAATATPAKDRARTTMPETPQTALRNGVGVNHQSNSSSNINNPVVHASPIKKTTAANAADPNRRHSTVTTAGAAAMAGAGSKRTSNTLVGPAAGAAAAAILQSRGTSGNLAQIAAQQSMGVGVSSSTAQNSAGTGGRWRT